MKVVSKTHWEIKQLCVVTKRLSQQTYLDLVMRSCNYGIAHARDKIFVLICALLVNYKIQRHSGKHLDHVLR
jgi:hypothetical protein